MITNLVTKPGKKFDFYKEEERERVLEAWECWALESALVEH